MKYLQRLLHKDDICKIGSPEPGDEKRNVGNNKSQSKPESTGIT